MEVLDFNLPLSSHTLFYSKSSYSSLLSIPIDPLARSCILNWLLWVSNFTILVSSKKVAILSSQYGCPGNKPTATTLFLSLRFPFPISSYLLQEDAGMSWKANVTQGSWCFLLLGHLSFWKKGWEAWPDERYRENQWESIYFLAMIKKQPCINCLWSMELTIFK